MQIHELTSKRRKVNEGPMAALKGIGTVAAQGVNQALGTNIGGTGAGAYQGAGLAAQAAATKANAPLVKKMAMDMQNNWLKRDMPNLAKAAPNGVVEPADQADAITKIINSALHFDYTHPPVDPNARDGLADENAKLDSEAIAKSVQELVGPGPKTADSYWKIFSTIAQSIVSLQSLSSFNRGASAATATDPKAQAAMQAMGLDARSLVALNAAVKRSGEKVGPTGSPTIDGILKAAKII